MELSIASCTSKWKKDISVNHPYSITFFNLSARAKVYDEFKCQKDEIVSGNYEAVSFPPARV